MNDYLIWFSIAGFFVFMELLTGTFYLLMVAFGSLIGGVVAFLWPDQGLLVQCVSAGSVAAISVVILHRAGFGHLRDRKKTYIDDSDVNLDIGQKIYIDHWHAKHRTRADYRGTQWDVELLPTATQKSGEFVICAIRSNRLIVDNLLK